MCHPLHELRLVCSWIWYTLFDENNTNTHMQTTTNMLSIVTTPNPILDCFISDSPLDNIYNPTLSFPLHKYEYNIHSYLHLKS